MQSTVNDAFVITVAIGLLIAIIGFCCSKVYEVLRDIRRDLFDMKTFIHTEMAKQQQNYEEKNDRIWKEFNRLNSKITAIEVRLNMSNHSDG